MSHVLLIVARSDAIRRVGFIDLKEAENPQASIINVHFGF